MYEAIEKLKGEESQDIEGYGGSGRGGGSINYKKGTRLHFSTMGFRLGIIFKSEFCHLNCYLVLDIQCL